MKIVITGTTSGIGKALALYYAQPGVTLGLIGRRQALLTTTATACTARGATVVPAALDVRDGAAMRAYAEQFVRQTQGIDLVIANAGVGEPDDLRSGNSHSAPPWRRSIDFPRSIFSTHSHTQQCYVVCMRGAARNACVPGEWYG